MSPRILKLILPLAIGIAFGLLYGWVIDPVEYVDITPEILRADFRADYVLMVAEAYQAEENSELAARRLAILGADSPIQIEASTLDYARQQSFTSDEQSLLQDLLSAMQTYQPSAGESIP
jgi:hypothetical protein